MKWIKKGFIFKPDGRYEWMQEFAQVPTPLELDDRIRIYYTTRPKPKNGQYVSYTSFIDVDKENPEKIIYIHDRPVLELGTVGAFDEFGIHPGDIARINGKLYFFYQGWERSVIVPYKTSLGIASSDDNGFTFYKCGAGPLMSRTLNEPFLDNGFFVYKKDKYYLFYSTCFKWEKLQNKYEPIYKIVCATSEDGFVWNRDGKSIIESHIDKEITGRPTVLKINQCYHMWFCYRNVSSFRTCKNDSYKIGYAYSFDLYTWYRNDDLSGINLSDNDWDSEMQAYPYVLKIKNNIYLFYNGNNFGKDGFGYAILDQ